MALEGAGLAVGVVALASSFNNAVQCFEYVQIARTFGQSFQTSLIQLDAAKLRLTRWGASIGIARINDESSLAQTQLPPEQIKLAEEALGHVDSMFKQAKMFSERYQPTGASSTAVYDPTTDLDSQHRPLYVTMEKLSRNRQGSLNLAQKTKWALRDEKRFKKLLEELIDLVDILENTFPSAQEAQKQLCVEEVAEMQSGDNLTTLRAAIGDQDKILSDVLAKVLSSSAGAPQSISNVFGDNKGGFQMGVNNGSIGTQNFGSKPSS